MTDLARGDVVSLSRAQTSRVDVLTAPAVVDELYSITLPIGDVDKTFTFLGTPGETTSDVADGLETILLRDQTPFSVAVGPAPSALTIVGALGQTFAPTTTTNLQASVPELAVLSVDNSEDPPRQIGRLRVIGDASTAGKIRSFTTRDRDGNLLQVEQISLRELDSGNLFEVDRSLILTIIEKEGTTPL